MTTTLPHLTVVDVELQKIVELRPQARAVHEKTICVNSSKSQRNLRLPRIPGFSWLVGNKFFAGETNLISTYGCRAETGENQQNA